MIRSILSVLAGMALWSVLWLGGNAALQAAYPDSFAADGMTTVTSILVFVVVFSLVCSVAAGYVTARVARRAAVGHTVTLGIVQLVIGVAVQASVWEQMPLWYHFAFLALLLPGNVLGGLLCRPRLVPALATP